MEMYLLYVVRWRGDMISATETIHDNLCGGVETLYQACRY